MVPNRSMSTCSKGDPRENTTKFWITTDSVELAADKGTVDKKDMARILRYLKRNRRRIIDRWVSRYGKAELKR